MPRVARLFFTFFILSLTAIVHADDIIIGKVVGVADGDTITVLENRTQYKIRLYGIDTPESHQDFGNRAKQFTSDLVFGKQVCVIKKDMDRYGRTVGMVYVGDVCANEALIENGLAWVYRKYCKMEICESWLELESMAIDGDIGLWSHPNPVPPWDFRGENGCNLNLSILIGNHQRDPRFLFNPLPFPQTSPVACRSSMLCVEYGMPFHRRLFL
nr:thermonuclease family protein [uncultured Desulfosarcina sp.]